MGSECDQSTLYACMETIMKHIKKTLKREVVGDKKE
jgi:hypothetical protein